MINKIDLAPLVGADLSVMERDTLTMRQDKPFVFTNLKASTGLDAIQEFIQYQGRLASPSVSAP